MAGTNMVKGRLTTGNKPLHERRKHLTNAMRDNTHMIRTMMANWPEEYQLPADHPIHEWLEVTDYICDEMEKPDEPAKDSGGQQAPQS